MELHYRHLGQGKPLIILHGVFGSSDNLFTIGRKIAEEGKEVFILDARNHGQSPRSEDFNYEVMAADLNEFIESHNIKDPVILGHSMGGKTVLQYSQHYTNFSKLIIVDITHQAYQQHHDHIYAGLKAIDPAALTGRKEAEEIFSQYVPDFAERLFLLKNLYRTENNQFDWRINIPVLDKNSSEVITSIKMDKVVEQPLLLMRGSESDYVNDEAFEEMHKYYPNAQLKTVDGANHWIHATKPKKFLIEVLDFIQP